MKRTCVFVGGVVLALASSSQPLVGHHGGAAYDQTKSVTFEGTVTEMQFANPHVLVYWDVKDGEATGQKWSGWLTAPNKLARAGWNRKSLNPGDKHRRHGNAAQGRQPRAADSKARRTRWQCLAVVRELNNIS